MKTDSLKVYIDELNKQYRTGIAREHSYRPALKDLLQSLLPKMVVTNEPAHFECGAPDYIIQREKDHLPVFFVEAKDVNDADLDGRNKNGHKEQFDRYKQALDYILFTDYLDFHLYEHGEFVDSVRIAETRGDKIAGIAEAEDKFLAMIQHLGDIDYSQLYAQVLYELREVKAPYWFNNNEVMRIQELNQEYTQQKDLAQIVESCFRKPEAGETVKELNSTQILKVICQDYPGITTCHSTRIQLGFAMKELGFEHVTHAHVSFYKAVPLKAA